MGKPPEGSNGVLETVVNPLLLNDNDNRKFIDLEEAHDLVQDLEVGNDANLANQNNYGEEKDAWFFELQLMQCKGLGNLRIFPRCHQSEFTPFSTPNTNSNNGAVTNISIIVQSEPGPVMTVAVILPIKNTTVAPVTASVEKEMPKIKLPIATASAILTSPAKLLDPNNMNLRVYSIAFFIFMADLIIFAAITNRRGGDKE